jgi:hypothetical protein
LLAAAVLAPTVLQQAACLPLDDLSNYSSAWERQAGAMSGEDALDASAAVDGRGDGGAAANSADAGLDAGTPLGSPRDAGDGAPAPDAGERPAVGDGGAPPDAGELDAALAP